MRFSLDQTSARSFELSLPDPEGRARELGFEHITELGGAVAIGPQEIALENITARVFQLVSATWSLPTGELEVGSPVAVLDARVHGSLPRADARAVPLEGTVKLGRLTTDRLLVDGIIPRLTCGLRIDSLALEQRGRVGDLALDSLAISDLETSVGDFLLRVDKAEIGPSAIAWTLPAGDSEAPSADVGTDASAGLDIRLASLSVDKMSARSRLLEIEVEDLEAREISWLDGALSLGSLSIGRVTVRIDLTELLARRGEHSDEDAPAKPGPRSLPLVDLRLLDRVDGQIDVDVNVDLQVPVLGRRKATHCFRVPVTLGVLNFRQIERGLSTLENAVIDFDVQEHKLVIERDLPVPLMRMRKNLVEWHLDTEEMALARKHLVRMRTLPRFEIPNGGSKNNNFKINGLQLSEIDVALSMTPRSKDERDGTPDKGPEFEGVLPDFKLGRLSISGNLQHPRGSGQIVAKIRALITALRGLRVGGFQVDVAALRANELAPVSVSFDGSQPTTLAATLQGFYLDGISLQKVLDPHSGPLAPVPVRPAPVGGPKLAASAAPESSEPGESSEPNESSAADGPDRADAPGAGDAAAGGERGAGSGDDEPGQAAAASSAGGDAAAADGGASADAVAVDDSASVEVESDTDGGEPADADGGVAAQPASGEAGAGDTAAGDDDEPKSAQ